MLLKEFANDQWNIHKSHKGNGVPYLEFANGTAWTITDNGVFWIETMRLMPPPDYAYKAMIKLGRKILGCKYLYG